MNDLFHNYYLVLPDLPHLRKMQGKTPVDTPWKTPLPGHEMQPSVPASGAPRAPAHAEGRRHAAPRRRTGEPSSRAPGVQSSPEAHIKAATWHL